MEATIPVCKNTLQCTSSTKKAAPKTPLHTGFTVQQLKLSPTLLFPGFRDNLKNNNNLRFYNTPEHQKYGSANVPKAQMSFSDNTETSAKKIKISVQTLAVAFCFGGLAGFLRTLLSVLPPDFGKRWRKLVYEKDQDHASIGNESGAGTIIYDCHGTVIAKIVPPSSDVSGGKGRKGRRPLRASDIPSFMWQAVVASEDRRFFEHHGIDPKGLARAALSMSAGGGGSTITQQLVKNVFLTNDRKWERKVVEMILALLVERHMSKWDILFSYLNKIYWGHGLYGIERASAFYFGKHPSLLTLGECAMLAGIIPAPELLSPYRDPSRGKKPQGRTLRRMVEAGFLHPEMAEEALCETLFTGSNGQGVSGLWRAPYFVSEVLYELAQKYGHDTILRDGLQVYTTLDLERQEIAEKVINEEAAEYDQERITLAEKKLKKAHDKVEDFYKARQKEIDKAVTRAIARVHVEWKHSTELPVVMPEHAKVSREAVLAEAVVAASEKAHSIVIQKYAPVERYLQGIVSTFEAELKEAAKSRLEGAVVAIEPLSGAVQILVGGRDFLESSFNRATLAFRSPGSTFKPVVFLAALAQGMTRGYTLLDEPCTFGSFTPENYDRKFRGRVTLEEALVKSLNVPTVKLCAEIGVDKVCNMSRALGIESPLPHELPLSLGGCEVTPLQLATVYSTIAAGGFYRKPYIIRRVETGNGRVLEEVEQSGTQSQRVVDENAISEIRQLLQAVVEQGTGRAARLGRPCAGKTGTSDGHRDVWFAGFTPELACVLWFGYDDNATVGGLHPGTGASHAAPVWKRLMKHIHKGLSVKKFHDRGNDKYGMRSSYFIRKSRRACRIGIKDVRNSTKENHEKVALREVWDWENASSVWSEKEKMKEWTEDRLKQAKKINVARAP
ncbi:hypothetical protein SUGI_1027890 [Cryptomeria japonica]|uniref:uncharacterized protein LOC131078953 n=1 Tax=Cryptomeria japonica TaxID=3369 RepID=UPI0024148DA4|nr:uncharacterized protein LOC131078953 [Cryptomeria japonica]XP_057872786.2 uncharacterized protein LOC131078953 [Cryptomeria japonica]GLJ48742.1 hypothetical protein SUGI_1027890 [Cryptomeria japonica]